MFSVQFVNLQLLLSVLFGLNSIISELMILFPVPPKESFGLITNNQLLITKSAYLIARTRISNTNSVSSGPGEASG